MNKLLILYLLIFVHNLSFYKSKVDMNRKVEMFVFNFFCVACKVNSLSET